jgi:hypothetical protein
VRISRIVRTCDFCNKTINKGDKYGSTKAGFIYCEKCK